MALPKLLPLQPHLHEKPFVEEKGTPNFPGAFPLYL